MIRFIKDWYRYHHDESVKNKQHEKEIRKREMERCYSENCCCRKCVYKKYSNLKMKDNPFVFPKCKIGVDQNLHDYGPIAYIRTCKYIRTKDNDY